MKIKNSVMRILCLFIAVLMLPVNIFSAGLIAESEATLTIAFKAGDTAIKNAAFSLYRVGDVDQYGVYTLTEAFSGSSVDLKGHEATYWQEVTEVLEAYQSRNKIPADYTGKTDSNGMLEFKGLEKGLYLVIGTKKTQDGRTYTPSAFLTALPLLDDVNNEWMYSVTVSPKYTSKTNGGGGSSYVSRKVIKVWADEDYEHNRPKSVRIVLLKDGAAHETVTLNDANDWKYEWTKLSDSYTWTIAEEEVPEGYKVSMTKSGNTYVITNTYKPDDDNNGNYVSRTVIKVWDDAGYEKERPNEVVAVLLKDGQEVDSVKLSEGNSWKHEWTGLSATNSWSVEEKDVLVNYTSKIKKDGSVYIITNTYTEDSTRPDDEETTAPDDEETTKPRDEETTKPHDEETTKPDDPDKPSDEPGDEESTEPKKEDPTEDEKVSVRVHKVWDDGGYAERPDKVQVEILKDGEVYETVTLSGENNWQYSLNELPKGSVWSVREKNVPEGYTQSVTNSKDTFVITNKLIPPDMDLKVQKIWKDTGHEDERPNAVEVELMGDGEVVQRVKLNEENNWQYTFEKLDGSVTWSVREKTLDKYTSKVVADKGGYVIINTYSVIPQTGQLWWPVPWLSLLGLAMVIVGILCGKGKEHES